MHVIRAFFRPPSFANRPQETRRARQLHIILWVVVLAMAIETPIAAAFVPNTPPLGIALNLVMLVGGLVLLGVLRLGNVNLVALLLVLLIEALILFGNLAYERPFTTTEMACVLIIFFTGVLGERRMVVFATLVSVAVVSITLLVWLQWPMPERERNWMILDWLGYTTLFMVSGCLAYVSMRSLHGTLGKLQDSEKLLEKQNQELAREIAERREAEQKQQLVAVSLRGVLNCASEMLACETQDDLWKKAIELARTQLGIERCAIFVRDPETNEIVGTFGTDLQGRTTVEQNLRFVPTEPIWLTFLQELRTPSQWVVNRDASLYEINAEGNASKLIGKGWVVLTPICSREDVPFALMSNDCAISSAPLDDERQDLLAVYCSLLGNIAERKYLETQLQGEAAKIAAVAERARLARELHDSVSQALFGIALGARTAQEQLNHPSEYSRERVAAPISYVLDLSQAALAEMRALIFELRPESLHTEGLIAAFEKQAAALYARHRIVVSTHLGDEEPPLDIVRKEALYRIGLEAIQNTIKHARATQVELCLSVEPTAVRMDVRDNGLGFNPLDDFPGHLGLQTMRERAEELGGTFAVTSGPNQGTAIEVVLPIGKTSGARLVNGTNGHKPAAT